MYETSKVEGYQGKNTAQFCRASIEIKIHLLHYIEILDTDYWSQAIFTLVNYLSA